MATITRILPQIAHPSHGAVVVAFLVEALVYAALAVTIRRRFQLKGLLLVASLAAIGLSITVSTVEPFVSEFDEVPQLPVMGSILGVIASSTVVHRFIQKYPDPDIVPEIALGAAAFVAGVLVGIGLAGTTVLVIA